MSPLLLRGIGRRARLLRLKHLAETRQWPRLVLHEHQVAALVNAEALDQRERVLEALVRLSQPEQVLDAVVLFHLDAQLGVVRVLLRAHRLLFGRWLLLMLRLPKLLLLARPPAVQAGRPWLVPVGRLLFHRGAGGGRSVFLGLAAGVALLDVPHQVVLATESLRTELAEEVTLARVHHQVPFDVLASEKASLAMLALELLLAWALDGPRAGVDLEVVEDLVPRGKRAAAHGALESSFLCRVHGHVLAKAQHRVVLLAAALLVTPVYLLVWIVHLKCKPWNFVYTHIVMFICS